MKRDAFTLPLQQTVAVLFARADSIYKTLPGTDVWDIERNARLWPGGAPVVAHPPCRAWGRLRKFANPRKGERQLAIWSVRQVRRFGGVLEHPVGSLLWKKAGLPPPGQVDRFGGWTLPIHQNWWGHRAEKATLLYIVGCAPANTPPCRSGWAKQHMWSKAGSALTTDRTSPKPNANTRRPNWRNGFASWPANARSANQPPRARTSVLFLWSDSSMTTTPATPQQIELLHHTLGLRVDRRDPFRNYFVAGPGHHDMADLEALESLGLMGRGRTPGFCDPSDIVFCTTDAGRALALEMLPEPPPPPKHSQHREWMDADTGFSFGEWLCGARLPKFESRGDWWRGTGEYRMYRNAWDGDYGTYRDAEGQWAKTKKDAKASYKAALKALLASRRTILAA